MPFNLYLMKLKYFIMALVWHIPRDKIYISPSHCNFCRISHLEVNSFSCNDLYSPKLSLIQSLKQLEILANSSFGSSSYFSLKFK